MKAIVYTGPGSVRMVDDWPEPACGPDDVVVQMRAVGLCGSDLSVYDGHRDLPSLPWVMGHEGGGDVVAVGERVDPARIGERVVVEPNLSCLTCAACLSGTTSDCRRRAVLGMNAPGILAERVAVPAGFALALPTTTPDEVLACFEPLAVARAAVRRAGVGPGDCCLVVGAGSQGVLVCLSLLAVGATPYVTEPHEGRLEQAARLGAVPWQPGDETPAFRYVFETAGAPAAFATAVRSVASTGTVVLIGLTSEPVQLSTTDVVRRGLTLIGSIIYDHPVDFEQTAAAVREGLRPEQAVQKAFSPEQAAEAFAGARDAPGKSWIDLTTW